MPAKSRPLVDREAATSTSRQARYNRAVDKTEDHLDSRRSWRIIESYLAADWVLHPPVPRPQSDEIHLWEFAADFSESTFATVSSCLSEEEQARAATFHFERDSRRFSSVRGALRSILAGYTGLAPREIEFSYSEHGKPKLLIAPLNVCFNVSHSGDRAMIAVALARDLGVDIEAHRANVEIDQLSERFFSAREREVLRSLPPAKRTLAFYRCWTLKEAFLKAQGVGLSRSLGSFDVDLNTGQGLLATRPDPDEAKRWSLIELEAPEGYSAAAAAEGSITSVTIFRG